MSTPRFVSYAQNLEDVMLWRALHEAAPAGGFYVDVGASDPTLLSVTRAFYERGWRGVNIEPLPDQVARLRAARPRDVVVQAAVADRPGTRMFHRVTMLKQTGLSTFDATEAARHAAAGAEVEAIETPVTTLAEVWRAHVDGPVHFLKIDAEGAEAEVLAGADFTVMRPWIILLEATAPLTEADTGLVWEPALLAAGYRFVWFDGLNRFYLAEEHAALARHFRVQPNIFDAYHQYDAPLMDHVAALEAAAHPAPAEPGPKPSPGLARRVVRVAFRVVRRLVRPVLVRARGFMLEPVLAETADLRRRIDGIELRLDSPLGAALERMMLTVALDVAPPPPAPPPPKDGLSNTGTGE